MRLFQRLGIAFMWLVATGQAQIHPGADSPGVCEGCAACGAHFTAPDVPSAKSSQADRTPSRAAFAEPLWFAGADYTMSVSPTGRVINLVVPPAIAADVAAGRSAPFTAQRAGLMRRVLAHLRDNYDFVLFVTDQPNPPTGSEYSGESIPVRNSTQGLGMSPFDNSAIYASSSAGRLQCIINLPLASGLNGPGLHEILHRWGNYLPFITGFSSHWGYSSPGGQFGGQLGGWARGTLVDLGGGTYSATNGRAGSAIFNTNANGGNAVPYAPLELYLMGLIPLSEVPEIQVAENAAFVTSTVFRASAIRTVTREQILASVGPRVPDHTQSQKAFRALQVVVSASPLTAARLAYFDTLVDDFVKTSSVLSRTGLYNFWEATGGRATMDMTVGAEDLKETYTPPTGIPAGITWATASATVVETSGTAVLTLSRSITRVGAVSIAYTTVAGTARAGEDFQARSGTVTWGEGDMADKTVAVPILAGQISGTVPETFQVVLSGGENAQIVGPAAAAISIVASGMRDPNFTIDAIGGDAQGVMVLPDGKLLIWGILSSVGTPGIPQGRIARLLENGTLDTTFNAGGSGANATILRVARQPDGKFVIVGNFTSFNGVARNRVARLHADGTLDMGFDPGTAANGEVDAVLVLPDGKILIGGFFSSFNGIGRDCLARLSADGSLDTSFVGPAFNDTPNRFVRGVARQPDGKIVVGGQFSRLSGAALTSSVCRLNPDGTLDPEFSGLGSGTLSGGSSGQVYAVAMQPDGRILIAGSFNAYNQTPRVNIARLNANGSLDTTFVVGSGFNAQVIAVAVQPDGRILAVGSFTTYNGASAQRIARLNSDGSADTAFLSRGGASGILNGLSLHPNGDLFVAGSIASTYQGSTTTRSVWRISAVVPVDILPPTISQQPEAKSIALGETARLEVRATAGSQTLSYQWYKNGVAIGGATASTLTVAGATLADAGSYSVAVSSAAGSVASESILLAIVEVTGTSRLVNLSVRAAASSGEQALFVGFAAAGSGVKSILLRAVGPTLGSFGVSDPMADPRLQLFRGSTLLRQNDDWGGEASLLSVSLAVGAFTLPASSRDAALLTTIDPTSYSAQASASAGSGVVLVEAYDADSAASGSRLVNLSARNQVGSGDRVLIVGFAIRGERPLKLLVRGVGPTLGSFGVAGTLGDPRLALYSGTTLISQNDNWDGGAATSEAFARVGAFALPAGSRDSAMLVTLQPGTYSVQVSGAADTTGVALLEIYELP